MQEHENFDKKFRQLKTEADFVKLTQTVNDKQITLPKSALMACNKTELNDIAKQYDLEFNEDDTKSKMVDAVMKAQANPSTKKEEVEAPMQQGPDGGIKQIFQNPQVN